MTSFWQRSRRKWTRLRVGHALAPTTDIGPVASKEQLEIDLGYIEVGMREAPYWSVAGVSSNPPTRVITWSRRSFAGRRRPCASNQEEIFGPVASVIRVRDYEEGLSVANDVPFGLSGGIITTSLHHAADFRRKIPGRNGHGQCTTAGVDYHVPFGGRRQSSYGPANRDGTRPEFYSSVKTALYCRPEAAMRAHRW